MSQHIEKDLFVFWKYDSFPYLLGGTVTEITDNGLVETIEYGPGHYFRPTKLFTLTAGKELICRLAKIKAERDTALAKVREEWDKKLNEEIGYIFGLENIGIK